MTRTLRSRFWLEVGLGIVSTFLLVLTLVHGDWIESVFNVDPDQGNGSLEWLIVAVAAAVTVAMTASAWREWRAAPATT